MEAIAFCHSLSQVASQTDVKLPVCFWAIETATLKWNPCLLGSSLLARQDYYTT